MAVASHMAKLSFFPLNRPGFFSQLPCNKFLHIQRNKASTATSWSLVNNGSRNLTKPMSIRGMASSFGSWQDDSVTKTVADNPVVVYSKSWCPWVEISSFSNFPLKKKLVFFVIFYRDFICFFSFFFPLFLGFRPR